MSEGVINQLWARSLVDALVGAGIRHVCVSPGSRSAPLVLAVAERADLTTSVHVDERSAGFFALGYGRATGVPAALVCTSGTAAANYFPAVIEAHLSRAPMVILTADRPPELRDTGAWQSIDQLKLYGGYVRWFVEVGAPSAEPTMVRYVRNVAARAVATARGHPPGPVHLNVAFREPLVPRPGEVGGPCEAGASGDDGAPVESGAKCDGGAPVESGVPRGAGVPVESGGACDDGAPVESGVPRGAGVPVESGGARGAGAPVESRRSPARPDAARDTGTDIDVAQRALFAPTATRRLPADVLDDLAVRIAAAPRGLILAGQIDAPPGYADAVAELAAAAGYPILAEPTGHLRFGPHDRSHVVTGYDAMLRSGAWVAAHTPELVIRFGASLTWKHVALALERWTGAVQVVVDPHATWDDPTRLAEMRLIADPIPLCEALTKRLRDDTPGRRQGGPLGPPLLAGDEGARRVWQAAWRDAMDAVQAVQADVLAAADDGLGTVAWVHRALAELVPDGTLLYAASSMAVRDLDTFTAAVPRSLRVMANRGAAGIDGTVSSALGAAYGSGAPTVLVTGDLAFAHDLNGLGAADLAGLDVTVIVLDDGGGGIFAHLPVADLDPTVFERFFVTPSGLDIAHACAAYAIPHTVAHDVGELRAALAYRAGASDDGAPDADHAEAGRTLGSGARAGRAADGDAWAGRAPAGGSLASHEPASDARGGHAPASGSLAGHEPASDARGGHAPARDARAGLAKAGLPGGGFGRRTGGVHVVEVPIDRAANTALHRRYWAAATVALERRPG